VRRRGDNTAGHRVTRLAPVRYSGRRAVLSAIAELSAAPAAPESAGD
jgi:hypothetical protein